MRSTEGTPHVIPYSTLTVVWVALVILTGLSVAITRAELGAYKVWGALAVACVKSGLVIAIFMHMKYESRLLRAFLLVALVTLAIFIGFTFFDVLYR